MEWLPESHLAYFVLDVVRELDLGAIEATIHAKDRAASGRTRRA
jgi:hypothetical protein